MTINLNKFTHHLDGQGLSKERKLEIVRIVYQFVQEQADYAFGIHPLQCCGYDHGRDSQANQDDQYLEGKAANDNEFNQKERA